MSKNRENITWQSADGTWSRGFYAYREVNLDSEDFDSEWDVEYDYEEFGWASTGHSSMQQANDAWKGVNPGSTTVVTHSRATAKECARYDEMVWRLRNPEAALKKDQRALRAKIKKVITTEGISAGNHVKITVTLNASIKHYGTGWVYTGVLVEDGNWLVVPGTQASVKVQNIKTGAIHKDISSISKVAPPQPRSRYTW